MGRCPYDRAMPDDVASKLDPSNISSREFSSSFRGLDPTEVRAFLREVADAVRDLERRLAGATAPRPIANDKNDERLAELEAAEASLTAERAELEATIEELRGEIDDLRSAPVAQVELDESTLTKLLGEETTRVLDSARSAAADITSRSEAESKRRSEELDEFQKRTNEELTAKRVEVDEYDARIRTAADEQAAAIKAEAEAEAERRLADAATAAASLRNDAEIETTTLRNDTETAAAATRDAASEVAAAVKARAEEVAKDTRLAAEADAESIRAEADAIRSDAQAEAARIRAEAAADASTAADAAREEARLMVTEAQAVREKVLADLVKRRRTGRQQLDQVKAARDRMLRSLGEVRNELDSAANELELAIPEARRAMERAGRSTAVGDDNRSATALASELDSARKSGIPVPGLAARTVPDEDDAEGSAPLVEVEVVDSDELDGLFARIREERNDGDSGDESTADQSQSGPPTEVTDESEAGDGDPIDAAEITADLATDGPDDDDIEAIDPGPDFTARDIAFTRSGSELRRKLKRALADDQSDILDRLQQARRKMSLEHLPTSDEQLERFRAAITPAVSTVATAGATHGGGTIKKASIAALVDRALARVVDPLRTRTETSVSHADGDVDEALEAIRAHYRDLRSGDLPEIVDDLLAESFALGLYESLPAGTPVRWVADPRETPSPDCYDNTLADDVVVPGEFPTGHAHPLGGPGCRCLVLPRSS